MVRFLCDLDLEEAKSKTDEVTMPPTSDGNDDDDPTPFSSVGRKKGEKKKKVTVCRSTWLGTVCKEVGCDRAHIPQCKLTTCRPKCDPNCSNWHAVASSASKNGRGGRGPPPRTFK
jgi:hypothetical protein